MKHWSPDLAQYFKLVKMLDWQSLVFQILSLSPSFISPYAFLLRHLTFSNFPENHADAVTISITFQARAPPGFCTELFD